MQHNNETVKFVSDVPPRKYRKKEGAEYTEVADMLREHPGQWAMVYTGKKGTARSCFDAMKRLGMEATTRERGQTVYARYNPTTRRKDNKQW